MSSGTQQNQPRYWCHICNAEVDIYMAPEPTCQRCNEQFIEELQSDDDPREFLAGGDNNNHTHDGEGHIHIHDGGAHFFSSSRLNGEMGDDIFQYFTPPSANDNTANDDTTTTEGAGNPPLGNFLQSLLTNMLGQNIEVSGVNATEGGDTNRAPRMFVGSMVDGNMRFQPMPGTMPTGTESGETPNNNNNTEEAGAGLGGAGGRGNSIASLMQLFSVMTGAPLDAGLVGNPNDYVFSQNALDNIITQLMEQTAGASAPPPAPEQVIESLPKRSLTDEEKSTETDCAVCKDQFEPHETVIELPCEHIFHDDCIKPWLKLNGTCPVCRHSVIPEQQREGQNNDDNGNNSEGNNNQNVSENENNNNNNTQDTNQQSNTTQTDSSNNTDNSNTTTRTAAWISGSGGNGTAQLPLNLSASFPWAALARGNGTNSSSTSRTNADGSTSTVYWSHANGTWTPLNRPAGNTNSSSNNTNTETNNPRLDDDIDMIDLD